MYWFIFSQNHDVRYIYNILYLGKTSRLCDHVLYSVRETIMEADSPEVVSEGVSDSFDDDDFGDFEEAEENGAPIGSVEENTGNSDEDTERIRRYLTTTMTPDEYEQMFRNDLRAAGMHWNVEDARKAADNDPICQRRFTDLEGPDMYGSVLAMERPEPSEDEKDPMKMARDVRRKVVEDLVGFSIK